MKVAIIVAYFGKMPDYYQLFLDSCKRNSQFDWMIFSDDDTAYNYPENVHLINMKFKECQKLVQSKFEFTTILPRPQKLCDYKCAYGIIFEEYIKDYTWWGHCDLDQIFGDLSSFITAKMLNRYDKLFSLGHLTLYRNTYDNNRVFREKINGTYRFKEVFTTERGCGFDEWLPGNVNEIYLQSKRPIFLKNIGADINPYKTVFEIVYFDIDNQCYKSSFVKNSIFQIINGHVYQLYLLGGVLQKQEFPYIHLQKRKMKDVRKYKQSGDYYIIPNYFIDTEIEPERLLRKCTIWRAFNYQFFKVKVNSLKYRLKNSDWRFTNVFKKE